jgi:heme/copper-type cytochrome/quinol oxidase subunit 2
VHLLLALILTVFLAAQASALAFVLRSRRAVAGQGRRRTDLLWTSIPVLLVLFLAARSWVAVVDVHRPAVAATGTPSPSVAAPR